MIVDRAELNADSMPAAGPSRGQRSRVRRLSVLLAVVVVAAGLKFFAFLPGRMQAATLVSMFSTPVAGGDTLLIQSPTTDANGVKYYSVSSEYQGGRQETVRVLEPTNPAPGRPRRLLYVLPVQAGVTKLASQFGDGLEQLRLMDAQDRYNLTVIAPSFPYEPWYGDNPADKANSMESFIVHDLVPWGDTFLPPGTTPQRLLVGYSKSGNGALILILRHPDVFSAAAAWDSPVQSKALNTFGALQENFGTQENYDHYYIPGLLKSAAKPFVGATRLWISGDQGTFTADMNALHSQLNAAKVRHTWVAGGSRAHNWSSGWLEGAMSGLDTLVSQMPAPEVSQRQGSGDVAKRSQLASTRQVPQNSAAR